MLDAIKNPAHLRLLDESRLKELADELRAETINAVSVTGGHLGAGLGVVELPSLHYVFDTPRDRLIWDVGHRHLPTRFSPAAATAFAPSARAGAFRASPSAPKANIILWRGPRLHLHFGGPRNGGRPRPCRAWHRGRGQPPLRGPPKWRWRRGPRQEGFRHIW